MMTSLRERIINGFVSAFSNDESTNNEYISKNENSPDEPVLLTVSEMAEKFGISKSKITNDCRRGMYPGAVKVDGKWRIPY